MAVEVKQPRRNAQIFLKVEKLDITTTRGIRQGLYDWGRALQRDANKDILRKPKAGRLYIRRDRAGRRRRHVASARGESPANMTGRLRRSLGWSLQGNTELEFGYGVPSSRSKQKQAPEYAEWLEFGSPGGKIKPRPAIQLAFNRTRKDAENYFTKGIIKSIEQGP